MWHAVAPLLADKFTLIIADLPGYGWSDMPDSDDDHTPYTKRAMAKVMIEAMEQLGHVHFALAGHDRGGRVSYRLALDHPGRLSKLAVLDIAPTYRLLGEEPALRAEDLPLGVPGAAVSAAGNADIRPWRVLPRQKMAEPDEDEDARCDRPARARAYLAPFRDPSRIHAMCEDYRAGAYADYEIDKADLEAGRKITIPMLALWGDAGVASAATTRSIRGRNGRRMCRRAGRVPGISCRRRIRM